MVSSMRLPVLYQPNHARMCSNLQATASIYIQTTRGLSPQYDRYGNTWLPVVGRTLNSHTKPVRTGAVLKSAVVSTKPNRGRVVRLVTHGIAEGRAAKPTPQRLGENYETKKHLYDNRKWNSCVL